MDGAPGVSFPGIPAGETFTYRYKVQQSGTYWYHSQTGLQEQLGRRAWASGCCVSPGGWFVMPAGGC